LKSAEDEALKKIYLAPDLTRMQQEEDKKLRDKLKELRNNGSKNMKITKQEGYNFHKADYGRICEELAYIDWKRYLDGNNVENIWQKIKEELAKCVEKYVPKKSFKRRKHARWMKKKILKLIKSREKQWQKCKVRPSHENQIIYKKKRNEVCNEIRKAKANFELRT
jgi:hypothetical protein